MMKTLIQYIMHRGIVVTLIQTALLITFLAAPTKLYWCVSAALYSFQTPKL